MKTYFVFFILVCSVGESAPRSGSPRSALFGGGRSGSAGSSPLQKQEQKAKDRWTIADWFDTKKVIAGQNMFLAMNHSTVGSEFYFGGDTATYSVVGGTESFKVTRGLFAAYTSIFGISGQYIDSTDKFYGWDALFNLRVIGKSIQNTNLTLFYGTRLRNDSSGVAGSAIEVFKNNLVGGSLCLYIVKQMGIEGVYQSVLKDKSDIGSDATGFAVEGSLFLDYGLLRVQGTWFQEKMEYTSASGSNSVKDASGLLGGVRFYF